MGHPKNVQKAGGTKVESISNSSRFLNFTYVYASGLLIAFNLATYIHSYINKKTLESISFYSSDGWCLDQFVSYGEHCFGDFSLGVLLSDQGGNVWIPSEKFPASTHPPLNYLVYRLFGFLWRFFSSNVSVTAYLIFVSASLLSPFIMLKRELPKPKLFLFIMVYGVSTLPMLMTIDRGSSVALSIPFIAMSYYGHLRNKPSFVIGGLVLASCVRPQFILLTLSLLIQRRYLTFAKALVMALFANVICFVLWDPQNYFRNMKSFIVASNKYSTNDMSTIWPTNYSLSHGIWKFIDLLPFQFNSLNYNFINLVSYMIIFSLVFFAYLRRVHDVASIYTLLAVSVLMIVPITYGYYTSILVFILVMQMMQNRKAHYQTSNFTNRLFTMLLFLTIMPLASPISQGNLIQQYLSLLWTAWMIVIVVSLAMSREIKTIRLAL